MYAADRVWSLDFALPRGKKRFHRGSFVDIRGDTGVGYGVNFTAFGSGYSNFGRLDVRKVTYGLRDRLEALNARFLITSGERVPLTRGTVSYRR